MNQQSIPQPKTGTYDTRKAAATRRRRHANGQYVTAAQREAFKTLMTRGGSKLLTYNDLMALSEHPNLTAGQRQQWGEQAAKMAEENQL